eukprot:scaffold216106_cov32-Tisochrysis_lutea.AAC.5
MGKGAGNANRAVLPYGRIAPSSPHRKETGIAYSRPREGRHGREQVVRDTNRTVGRRLHRWDWARTGAPRPKAGAGRVAQWQPGDEETGGRRAS